MSAPPLELFQIDPNTGKRVAEFRLKFQLENMVKSMIKIAWPRFVRGEFAPPPRAKSTPTTTTTKTTTTTTTTTKPKPTLTEFQTQTTKSLQDMGFAANVASAAVVNAKSFDDALALALTLNTPDSGNSLPVIHVASEQDAPARVQISGSSSSSDGGSGGGVFVPECKATLEVRSGFLCMLDEFVRARIKSLHEYCVICDEKHLFAGM